MKKFLSTFVFAVLLAMAGRAEAYDFVIGPDYGAVTNTTTTCTTDLFCGQKLSAGQPSNRLYQCVQQSKAVTKTCRVTVTICGKETNTSMAYNQSTNQCEYTCTGGTYGYVDKYDNPSCVACLNASHCDDGNECTTDTCSASKQCMHTPRTGGCCVDNKDYYEAGQGACGIAYWYPEERNIRGYGAVCVPGSGWQFDMEPLRAYACGGPYGSMCSEGACIQHSFPCTSDLDCATVQPEGWCEHSGDTYPGAQMYYAEYHVDTSFGQHACNLTTHQCNVVYALHSCNGSRDWPPEVPYKDNACLCIQAAGLPTH